LLDTFTFLWVIAEPETLSEVVRIAISNLENEVFLSVISSWEIALKVSSGGLIWPKPVDQRNSLLAAEIGFHSLPLEETAALCAAELPLLHRDPFDEC